MADKEVTVDVVEQRDERVQLRELDQLIERWIEMLREQIDTIDPQQLDSLVQTAKKLAMRLDANLPPSLGTAAVAEIRGILIDAFRQLDGDESNRPLDVLDDFLVRAESIRHIVRDAIDEDLPCDPNNTSDVAKLLIAWLPTATRADIAKLVGVNDRTLHRYAVGQYKGPTPRRLYIVAKLVLLLKDAWTTKGVITWFDRKRPDLGGRRPIDVLDDADFEQALFAAVRQGRAQHGS